MSTRLYRIGTGLMTAAATMALAITMVPSTASAIPAPCSVTWISPGGMPSISDRVARQEDYKAIEELKAQYVNAFDHFFTDPSKINDLLALMTDDICLDYGPYGIFHGKTAIKNYLQTTALATTAWSFHTTANPQLVVNGNNGTGQWRFSAHGVFKADYAAGVQNFFGNYQDAYTKTPSGWKFSTIIVLFNYPPTGP